jgi:hypothetical protein
MLLEKLHGAPTEKLVSCKSVDWLRPFGEIRIKNDIRVLFNHQENLTHDAFAQL